MLRLLGFLSCAAFLLLLTSEAMANSTRYSCKDKKTGASCLAKINEKYNKRGKCVSIAKGQPITCIPLEFSEPGYGELKTMQERLELQRQNPKLKKRDIMEPF